MDETKPFVATVESDARKAPLRVAFVTRRTSPQVKAADDTFVMTWPEGIFRAAVVAEALAIVLVGTSLFFDAPLEGLANPMQTPNPAKAPWYFLGLQELLHYFPPVVAGVLIPTLVIIALVIIPYFNVNIEADGVWMHNRRKRLQIFWVVLLALILLLVTFEVYAVLAPTLLIGAGMILAARQTARPQETRGWLSSRPLSFWIMTWFLLTSSILTVIGTFFRGPGWSWVWPWRE
jgi:quinol---cytochrome c reductase cytochrome c subunit, bacillus type